MADDGIYALRSKRTIENYLRVFRPLVWNIPLAIIAAAIGVITRPTLADTIQVVAIGLCFLTMIVPISISVSRLPALRRSEQLDKENLRKGLRPNGDEL